MKSIQNKIIANIVTWSIGLQIITCSQLAKAQNFELPFLASAGEVAVQKNGSQSYVIKSQSYQVNLELNENEPNLLKINQKEFRILSNLSDKQNFERLKQMLQDSLGNEPKTVSWQSKIWRSLFPEAHALGTWTIVAGIAAVAAIIWAISASRKAKRAEERRDATRNRLNNIRQENADIRDELHSEASTYRESCLASAETSHDAEACRLISQVH